MQCEIPESNIKENVDELFNNLFQSDKSGFYEKFMFLLADKYNMPSSELSFELENIFILHTRNVVDISYRTAINQIKNGIGK